MPLDDAIVLVRRKSNPFMSAASFAGVSWRDAGETYSWLLSGFDQNVAVLLENCVDGPARMSKDACAIYAGRFLDRVVGIGKRDCQIFRFHWNIWSSSLLEDERYTFGEAFATRKDPVSDQLHVLEIEPIWGPRWERQEDLKAWAFEGSDGKTVFHLCRKQLITPLEHFANVNKKGISLTHPGISPSTDESDIQETFMQLQARDRRHSQPLVM